MSSVRLMHGASTTGERLTSSFSQRSRQLNMVASIAHETRAVLPRWCAMKFGALRLGDTVYSASMSYLS